MADPAPTRLGPYEIISMLGKGGMGEVWKARDTRLDRDVAIKISAQQFSDRFEREARAIAKLNHSNICILYDVGPNYLVMELIEGPTLAERIRQGPIPLEEALRIANQIAAALEAAHEKGIVHRDLKPANIKIRPDGSVKVLDLGLAKSAAQPEVTHDSPTMLSVSGMILGTAGYMSPEQARGQEVDKRADIWAFGVVLYEMLTAKRLFDGPTVSDSLAAILTKEPDLTLAPEQTRRLLARCLEKDPRKRLRDIGDAMALVEVGQAFSLPSQSSGLLYKVAAAVFALIAATLAFIHFRATPAPNPALRLSVPLPGNALPGFLALSPDGRRLVLELVAQGKGLWLRSLDSFDLQPLPGTDSARAPFWSPDGKSIGFFSEGKLKTIPASGGPPQVLCDGAGTGSGGTWNREGTILFGSTLSDSPIRRVEASGGACLPVTQPEKGSGNGFPEFLPDGRHFVFVVTGGEEAKRGLSLASLDDPAPRRLLADLSSAVFVPSTTGKKYGYLLFLRGSALLAQPFDAGKLQLAGDALPVAGDASFSLNAPQIDASASAHGILVYANWNGSKSLQLAWLDRSGKELGRVGSIQSQRHVALSPDGKNAATLRRDDSGLYEGTWIYDVQRGGETRLTSPPLNGGAAVWSPDGSRIAFGSGNGLYLKDASGGAKEELLLEKGNRKTVSDWSRDGRYLIYTEIDPRSRGDIWYLADPLNPAGDRKPVKFLGTEASESQGQLSPDGRWLAYVSDESGRAEVYVRPFPSGSGRWKVSTGQGINREPRWRRDGKELFYLEAGTPNRLMAVPVLSGPGAGFEIGAPQPLFEFRAIGVVAEGNQFSYSPAADGSRFLVNVQAGDSGSAVNVIDNWERAALGGKQP